MKLHTFAALAAAFSIRYPAPAGTVGPLAASGEVGSIAAAGVRPYSASAGKLVYVKALEHFYVAGPTLIPADDFVQVTEDESKSLKSSGRARPATDEEVAAASAADAATGKVK